MILALFYRLLHRLGLHGVKIMTNEVLALTLSNAIEQQQFEEAISQVKTLRPIDTADMLALVKPALAWQLLERLPNR